MDCGKYLEDAPTQGFILPAYESKYWISPRYLADNYHSIGCVYNIEICDYLATFDIPQEANAVDIEEEQA